MYQNNDNNQRSNFKAKKYHHHHHHHNQKTLEEKLAELDNAYKLDIENMVVKHFPQYKITTKDLEEIKETYKYELLLEHLVKKLDKNQKYDLSFLFQNENDFKKAFHEFKKDI